jgi:hypothetical protein
MSFSGLVQLCPYWCSDLLCASLCSEPSVQPQHRKNVILRRNRTASYGWTRQHCTSSATRRPAATRQSPDTELLWKARPQIDVRVVCTGLLQPNAVIVCYWNAVTRISVGEWLNFEQEFGATCFAFLTLGWKSVSSKQSTVKLTLLYNCSVLLYNKFTLMFRVALCVEFFLVDRLQNSDVSETFLAAFIRRIYHTNDCILMVALDATVAPHSPFSYCPGWSSFKLFLHPKLRIFSVAHSGWCWRADALGHLRRLYHFKWPNQFQQSALTDCKVRCFMLARHCLCIWLVAMSIV